MIGVIILAHDQLRRTAQLARYLSDNGCKVVVHIDSRLKEPGVERMMKIMGNSPNLAFCGRRRCEWGTFSLVEACLDALELMFRRWPGVTHVCQLSGSCLPIKPIAELEAHLAGHADVDFIESVDATRDKWVVDGLSTERFTLHHPLPWRKYRWLFDRSVALQRRLGVRRRMPDGLSPRLGSQWWCLSRRTLDAILSDPMLPAYKRYFRTCWIPDESFFQTLAGKHSDRISGSCLTFLRFDPQGKPHVFYDDHLELLRNADGFFARKAWPGAHRLYEEFLGLRPRGRRDLPEPDAVQTSFARFEEARQRHRRARPGLLNHGCYPGGKLEERLATARPYMVIDGLHKLFPRLTEELNKLPGAVAHGDLYHPERVEFAGGMPFFAGNLSASPEIRDHKPVHFLSKLIWMGQGCDQCFIHDFTREGAVDALLLRDPNAHILRLDEAWLLDLHHARSKGLDAQALDAMLRECAAREAVTNARLAEAGTRAKVIRIGLEEILCDGVGAASRVALQLPEGLSRLAAFSGPVLPEGFADTLDRMPAAMAQARWLADPVRQYEAMTRVLRRKA